MRPSLLAADAVYLRGMVAEYQARLKAAGTVNIAALQANRASPAQLIRRVDGIAVIDIAGVLDSQESLFSLLFGSPLTGDYAKALQLAAADDDIAGVLLRIDSPGGYLSGMVALSDAVAAASAVKPTTAWVPDLAASAAYWVASQADEIIVGEAAAIGSVGTFAAVYDMSEAAANEGITVHVIRAGEHKGDLVPGTEVTESQLLELQRTVDAQNEIFLTHIARGRGVSLDQVREWNDGRVQIGQEAVAVGLADRVGTEAGAIQSVLSRRKTEGPRRVAARNQMYAPTAARAAQHRSKTMDAFMTYLQGCGLQPDATEAQAMEFFDALPADRRAQAQAHLDARTAPQSEAREPVQPPGKPADQVAREAAEAERARIAGIRRAAGTDLEETQIQALIDDPTKTEADASAAALQAMRANRPSVAGSYGVPAIHTPSAEQSDAVIEAAMLLQGGLHPDQLASKIPSENQNAAEMAQYRRRFAARYPEQVVDNADRRCKNLSLADLCERSLLSAGYSIGGMSIRDRTEMALEVAMNDRPRFQGASPISTSGLSNVLTNVAEVSAMSASVEADTSWERWCKVASQSHFHTARIGNMTMSGALPEVGPAGEIESGTVDERYQNITPTTYAEMMTMTRKDVMNDRMDLFVDLPQRYALRGMETLMDKIYEAFMNPDAPLWETGVDFYAAARGNLVTSNALSFEGLGKAVETMLEQVVRKASTDSGANIPRGLKPRFLHAPAALAGEADGLTSDKSLKVIGVGSSAKRGAAVNVYGSGDIDVITNARLSNSNFTNYSSTTWYLTCSPERAEAVRIHFVNGQQRPTVAMVNVPTNVLGLRWRVYYDFGVASVDPGAVVKSTA